MRERKRHTDRGVSSTPSVTQGGVTPPPQQGYPPARSDRGVTWGGVPTMAGVPHWPGLTWGTHGGVPPSRVPPGQVWWGTQGGVPPSRGTPSQVWWGTRVGPEVGHPPPSWTWLGYPPPPIWTWPRYPSPPAVDRLKTLPSLILRMRSVIILLNSFWSKFIYLNVRTVLQSFGHNGN